MSVRGMALGAAGMVVGAGLLLAPPSRPAYLPDPGSCPGSVLPGIGRDQTCDPGYAARVRHVTEAMKLAVYRRDGVDVKDRAAVEVDHRVPLSLGGQNRLDNLWAERWDGPYGAHAKDRLEALMYRMVCKGQVGIDEAQAVFLGDWTRAYDKFLGDPAHPRMRAPGAPDEDGDEEGFPR